MANSIIHKICDHFCKEFAIAPGANRRLDLRYKYLAFILRDIAKRVRDPCEQFGKIKSTKARLACPTLNLCDTQKCRKSFQKSLCFKSSGVDGFFATSDISVGLTSRGFQLLL